MASEACADENCECPCHRANAPMAHLEVSVPRMSGQIVPMTSLPMPATKAKSMALELEAVGYRVRIVPA